MTAFDNLLLDDIVEYVLHYLGVYIVNQPEIKELIDTNIFSIQITYAYLAFSLFKFQS